MVRRKGGKGMKKRLFAMFLLLVMAVMPMAQAEERTEAELAELYGQARIRLEEAGITVTDEDIQEAIKSDLEYEKTVLDYLACMDEESRELFAGFYESSYEPEHLAYALLINMGMGKFDPETWYWTPTSSQVYAFDAEVFNVSGMYTQFFRGVNAIVPGSPITQVAEDLSDITEEVDWTSMNRLGYATDGERTVFFIFNGQDYSATLESYGDWFNEKMIEETNRVLREQGFPHQLQLVTGGMDQMVALIYGTEEEASRIRRAIGVEEVETEAEEETLIEKLFPFLVG